jgi:ABC-type multidrug transport system ATPase subunit
MSNDSHRTPTGVVMCPGRYVEQDDIHSPQTTVREALSFSGHLRLAKDQSKQDVEAFVDQVRRPPGTAPGAPVQQ